MGTCFSVCVHRRPGLSFIDKVANVGVSFLLPLGTIGKPGASYEENLNRLKHCRKKAAGMMPGIYEKSVKDKWKVSEVLVPRSEALGGDVKVLLHVPMSEHSDLPLVVWIHGGGTTLNECRDNYGADVFNAVSATMETTAKFCWASVEYHLAPEKRFPQGVDDVCHAFEALRAPGLAEAHGYDTWKIHLAGVSAGAFYAAHAGVRLAKSGVQLASLGLLYVMGDPLMVGKSHRLHGDLPMCPGSWLAWSWRVLLAEGGPEAGDGPPSAERLRAGSVFFLDWAALRGTPVLNALASCDMLYDDGLSLGKVMREAGLEVEEFCAMGSHAMAHLFDTAAADKLFGWFRRALAT